MPRIKIISVGKTKERWLQDALQEYLKRLKPTLEMEFQWSQSDAGLLSLAAKEKHIICLDPEGKMMDSVTFSSYFQEQLEKSGARLTFLIGGAEGIPQEIKKAHPLISLSRMTFTHQMTRLILVEQIYRATEILKGSGYHK